jgi:uncharacterized cupredoxin-like copper-binding protein
VHVVVQLGEHLLRERQLDPQHGPELVQEQLPRLLDRRGHERWLPRAPLGKPMLRERPRGYSTLRMRRAIPLLLAVLPLAACGGGGRVSAGSLGMVAPPPSIEDRGTAEVRGGRAVVRMGDDYFRPTVIRGAAGARVAVVLVNVGRVAHAFAVSGDGQKVDVVVASGARATVRVRIPRAGRLLFFCKLHWSRGMAGYLEPVTG